MSDAFPTVCISLTEAVGRVEGLLRMTGINEQECSVAKGENSVILQYPGDDEFMPEIISTSQGVFEHAARPFPVEMRPVFPTKE